MFDNRIQIIFKTTIVKTNHSTQHEQNQNKSKNKIFRLETILQEVCGKSNEPERHLKASERHLRGIWKAYERHLTGIWKASECDLKGIEQASDIFQNRKILKLHCATLPIHPCAMATFCYASVMTKYEHCSEKTSSSSSLNDWCEKTNRGYKINANPISSGSELQLYCNANDRYQYLIPSIESFVLRLQDVKHQCRVNLLLIK